MANLSVFFDAGQHLLALFKRGKEKGPEQSGNVELYAGIIYYYLHSLYNLSSDLVYRGVAQHSELVGQRGAEKLRLRC